MRSFLCSIWHVSDSYNHAEIETMPASLVKKHFKATHLSSNKLLIVQFKTEWSGACQIIQPVYEELACHFKGMAVFFCLEADHQNDLFTQFEINEFPTIIFFKNYKVVDHITGLVSRNNLIAKIERALQA